jgi:predicted O-methyltransferase YrrM
MQLTWRDVAIGDGKPINTSLTADETAELQRLAKDADVLEIGSAYGYSTCAIALVAKSVVAVDPHFTHGSEGALNANLTAYGVREKVDIRVGYSQVVLPQLSAEGRKFGMVWVDGDHVATTVIHDIRWALKMLTPGGTLALHDLDEVTCPGVRSAVDAWRPPDYVIDTLAVYEGIGGT